MGNEVEKTFVDDAEGAVGAALVQDRRQQGPVRQESRRIVGIAEYDESRPLRHGTEQAPRYAEPVLPAQLVVVHLAAAAARP